MRVRAVCAARECLKRWRDKLKCFKPKGSYGFERWRNDVQCTQHNFSIWTFIHFEKLYCWLPRRSTSRKQVAATLVERQEEGKWPAISTEDGISLQSVVQNIAIRRIEEGTALFHPIQKECLGNVVRCAVRWKKKPDLNQDRKTVLNAFSKYSSVDLIDVLK